MSSVLSERDRAIGAYCATGAARLCTAPERTRRSTTGPDLTSRAVKPFLGRLSGALLLALLPSPPAAAVDVLGNDTTDSYEISGAAILDGSFAEARDAATCSNCHWRIVRLCSPQTLDERLQCTVFPCAIESTVAEIWRADAPSRPAADDPLWTYHGLACLTGAATAVSTISPGVKDLATRAVPALRPASQPGSVTLTGLPTVFSTRQPAEVHTEPAVVGGLTVVVHAIPTWTWDFGHGSQFATSDPGGGWPLGRIRHTYPKRGIFRVRVTSSWRATYEVRGISDLPVDGVVTQSAWFDLRVREARRFLHKPKGA